MRKSRVFLWFVPFTCLFLILTTIGRPPEVRANYLVQTIIVPATDASGAWTIPLTTGQWYEFTAYGVYDYSSGRWAADPEWIFFYPTPSEYWVYGGLEGTYGESNDILDLVINNESVGWMGSANGVDWTTHTYSPNHKYKYLYRGQGQPVKLHVADLTPFGGDGYEDNQGFLTVEIAEVPSHVPVVTGPADVIIDEGGTFSGSGFFTDPGADTWTATVDYGDGAGVQPLALNSNKTFSLSHSYADSGVYAVTIKVTDDDGGSGTATTTVTVENVTTTTSSTTTTTVNTTTTAPSTSTTTLRSIVFPDVPQTHPYATAIEDLASRGIISGYTDGRFGPSDPVTRSQFAKMIDGTIGLTVSEELVSPFTDLGQDNLADLYPHEYVAAAYAAGITKGITPTVFGPYRSIIRSQVITMAVRAAQEFRTTALLVHSSGWRGAFPAGDPTHGANTRLAEYNGLLNTFGPSQNWTLGANATRGEVAQLLYAMDNLGKPSSTTSHPFVLWESGALKLLNEDGTRTNLLNLPNQSPVAWSADGLEVYYLDNQFSTDWSTDWDLMELNVASRARRLVVTSGEVTDLTGRDQATFYGVVNPVTGEIYIEVDNGTMGSISLVSVAPVDGAMQWRSGTNIELAVSPGGSWLASYEYPLHEPSGRYETLVVAPATAGNGAERYVDPPLSESRDTVYRLRGWWNDQTFLAYRGTDLLSFVAPTWNPTSGPRGYPSGAAWFRRSADGTSVAYMQVEERDAYTSPNKVSLWLAAGDGSGARRLAVLAMPLSWDW